MKKKEKINRKRIEKSIDIDQLTESIIRKIITEQDIVLDDPLVKIFISPFTDVIKTAKGETEKLTATVWSNVASLAKQAACLAIPFIAASTINEIQKEADEKLKERLSQIDASYADVLKRNWDTLRSRDVWGITFLLNPAIGIAEKFLMKAPYQSLGILEVLSGRNPKVVALREKAKILATHVSPNYGGGGGGGSGGDYGGYGGMDGLGYGGDLGTADYSGDGGLLGGDGGGHMGESLFLKKAELFEQQQQVQQQQNKPQQQQQQQKKLISQKQFNNILIGQIEALKKDPEIQKALQTSPVVQQMQAAALESVMAAAGPILKANSYEQLKSALGQDFNKFEQQMKKTLPEGATPEQEKQFKQALVPEIKVFYKKMLIQQLQKQVGNNKALVKPMQQLIAQINKG